MRSPRSDALTALNLHRQWSPEAGDSATRKSYRRLCAESGQGSRLVEPRIWDGFPITLQSVGEEAGNHDLTAKR